MHRGNAEISLHGGRLRKNMYPGAGLCEAHGAGNLKFEEWQGLRQSKFSLMSALFRIEAATLVCVTSRKLESHC